MQEKSINYEIEKKKSTTGIIVQKLIELIRLSSLKPGDKLPPERELSEIMNVSRPSLREALKSLEMMNVITIKQGSGTFVNKLHPESVAEHFDIVFALDDTLYRDLYKARRVLESAIARMAAENITDEELAEIETNTRKAVGAVENPKEFLELDFQLHTLILKAAKNRILPVFIQSINKLNLIMRKKTNSVLTIRQSTIQDHQKILEALKERNPDKAANAMEEHLLHVERGFYSIESRGEDSK
ncbi:MAG: FadR/GntR family transcriptional regulator [Spirochaetes bacterium]|nr:FadR/GntR family transcriptional regulator [Spirochaetota bacterium]